MQVVITPMDDSQLQELPDAEELAAQLVNEVGAEYAAQVADAIAELVDADDDEDYSDDEGEDYSDDEEEDPQSGELPMSAPPQQRGYNSGEIGISRYTRIKRR